MAIYYVDPVNGNDGNTGLHPTTNEWKTTQHAFDTVAAGSEIRLMATGTETLAATLTQATTGTDELPIWVIGADSAGDPLTIGYYTITANGIGANLYNITEEWYIYKHIRFTDADPTFDNISETINSGNQQTFENCRIDSAGNHGVLTESSHYSFRNCVIDNNGAAGIKIDTINRGHFLRVLNCAIHTNGAGGVEIAGDGYVIKNNLFYNNTGSGITGNRYVGDAIIDGNIFYNNSADGVTFSGSEAVQVNVQIYNNIFSNNGAYGMDIGSTYNPDTWFVDYNAYYNNTSNAVNWLGTGYSEANRNTGGFGTNNAGGDPLFTSVTGGSEDFTLGAGSPCIDTGFGYNG